MKNLRVFLTASIFFLGFVLSNCNRNPDSVFSTQDLLIRSSWSVDYFFDAQDVTGNYTNGKILFSNTGAVGYQKDGVTTPGNWAITKDLSGNEMMSVHFETTDPYISKLNQTWNLTDHSSNSFQFGANDGLNDLTLRIKVQ